MHLILTALLAASLHAAPERIWKIEVTLPAGWARHDAGGVVRLAPKGLPQPQGVTFYPPDSDPNPKGWLKVAALQWGVLPAKAEPPCPFTVALCQTGGREWPDPQRFPATAVGWVLNPAGGKDGEVKSLQAAVVQTFAAPSKEFLAQASALLGSVKVVSKDLAAAREATDPLVAPRPFGIDQLPAGLAGDWRTTGGQGAHFRVRIYLSGDYAITPFGGGAAIETGHWGLEGDAVTLHSNAAKDPATDKGRRYKLGFSKEGAPVLANADVAIEVLERNEEVGQQPLATNHLSGRPAPH